MKHKHHELIVKWVADTSKVVQAFDSRTECGSWVDVKLPVWHEDTIYRFKPEPKPDVIATGIIEVEVGATTQTASYWTKFRVSEHFEKDNIRLTFDCETGKLKKAEVL